ncbi:MAG: helix-turn-helix domain-containing protein [Ruminococcaceae bacterium]|nr:helix-turn-helix domain-containing protein [Oscillospiraceae bacterium]
MGTKLKQIREKLNMTQAKAAEYLGVSRRSYQDYENDDRLEGSIKYNYMSDKLRLILEDENKRILSVEAIKNACESVFSTKDVSFCYLFGSYAKGKAREDSDIDLLIYTNLTGLNFFGLVEELRETLHKKVDVLTLSQLENNTELINEILKDGIKIYG